MKMEVFRLEQKKRGWLYCRIDTPEDTHGALKIQKKELVNYAEQMKFEIVGSSEDLGSLRIFERSGLAECMEAAEAGKMDVLVVKSLSRLGRDTAGTLELLHELHQLGVTLYSPLEGAFLFPHYGFCNYGPAMKMK
jgi:DNA invertase Pin-like site-specific DNA recombinase